MAKFQRIDYTDEFKDRLKTSIKSINDNFTEILSICKVNENASYRNNVSRMAEFFSIKNEVFSRTTLITKAANELLSLTNDFRQFLILRDFNFISTSLADLEKKSNTELSQLDNSQNILRQNATMLMLDLERELAENFMFRH